MVKLHRMRATLLTIFITALSSCLMSMESELVLADKENNKSGSTNIVLSKREKAGLHFYKNANNALSLIREFNFRVLAKSDGRLEKLHLAVAYFFHVKASSDDSGSVYFDNDKYEQMVSLWSTTVHVYEQNENLRAQMIVNLFRAFEFLEKVMKSKKMVSGVPKNIPANIFNTIVEIKSFLQLYTKADNELSNIRKFNFIGFKRNNENLQLLHEELVRFFNRNAHSDTLATAYFSNDRSMRLINSWIDTKQCFEQNRGARMQSKQIFFDSVAFFEEVISSSEESDLCSLLQDTRKKMANAICGRQ